MTVMLAATIVVLTFLNPVICRAQNETPIGYAQRLENYLLAINYHEDIYFENKVLLQSTGQADWDHNVLVAYLDASMGLIAGLYSLYLYEDRGEVISADGLKEMEILAEWPENPFNNWEPIPIVIRTEDMVDFSPGDFVFERCPEEYATRGRRLSYQYYIIGDDPAAPAPEVTHGNEAWAVPPPGTVCTAGVHHMDKDELEAYDRVMEAYYKQKAKSESGE